MADYNVKSMGAALDSMCCPADACRGHVVLKENDLFYDPNCPGKIMYLTGSPLVPAEYATLLNGKTIINEASGLQYHFDENDGIVFDGFAWGNKTYIIQGVIPYNVTMPEKCTLIFEGGKFTGSLTGNNTTIEAGPVQIFDVNISLNGTFTNEYAYSEWWGAVATISTSSGQPNCRASIQAALDSIFGEIRFCPGYYYVKDSVSREGHELALLYLNYTKILRLSGNSHYYNGTDKYFDGATSVIWTDNDANILLINVLKDWCEQNIITRDCRTLISGGEFNASKCSDYSQSAILVYAKGTRGLRIETSVCGPINTISKTNGMFSWPGGVCPDTNMMNNGYLGYGIKFTHNPTILDNSGNLIQGKSKGICYLSKIDSYISGFGHGFTVDYSAKAADMTSMELRGYIENCLRYIYAPSRAFNGGVVECVIQTRQYNATDGFSEPIIQGDFTEAFINPEVWDVDDDIKYFSPTSNSYRMRFGQRILNHFCHYTQGAGMEKNFPASNFWSVADTPGVPEVNGEWEKSVKGVAAIISGGSSAVMGGFGLYDLNTLSASNSNSLVPDYVHLVDNDLLSIDSMNNDFSISIENNGLVPLSNEPYCNYIEGIWKPGTSPFDRTGMVFTFDDLHDNSNASLVVNVNFSSEKRLLQFMAVHLKGTLFNHFSNLRLEIKHYMNSNTNDQYVSVLFNGPYCDFTQQNNLYDIILPFFFTNSGQKHYPVSLTFAFSGFVHNSNIWGKESEKESFKFAIEGRYNRHYNHQVFTSSGGAIGRPLTKFGKLFISGTETYSCISALPSDAANGALATIGSGNVLTNYPVIKTLQGWMIQGLVGTTQSLGSLPSLIGAITTGQHAFNTDLGKPVWWNGSAWVDAAGTAIV